MLEDWEASWVVDSPLSMAVSVLVHGVLQLLLGEMGHQDLACHREWEGTRDKRKERLAQLE